MNTFIGDIVKNLEMNQYSNFDPVINNVKVSSLRAIVKYQEHPSILAIQNSCINRKKIAFEEMDLSSIERNS